eukprot:TRINITY_DN11233_c0_g1_i1.p1 TRINITY_DN11233_c0_g1~~TRINITY_DN11233_c0_g1_i1.p1  ORF type:complete len:303 (-),score=90.65 TRINITY_DN11233_c0_g1_i1:198-1070(-)
MQEENNLTEIRGKKLNLTHRESQNKNDNNKNLFFVHGLGGRGDQFANFYEKINKQYSVTFWDFYGCGKSKIDNSVPSKELYERFSGNSSILDLLEIFEKHKKDKNILVGHSMGTRVIIGFLDYLSKNKPEYLDSIEKVVLLGVFVDTKYNPFMEYAHHYILEWIRPLIRNKVRKMNWHPNTDMKIIENEETFTKSNTMYMIQAVFLQKIVITPEIFESISKINEKIPFLIISGSSDLITPLEQAQLLESHLSNKEHVIVENCSHMIMFENPKDSLKHINDFCQLNLDLDD